jgi:hypothetical protein
MFTVEFEQDHTKIVTVDQSGTHEDVEMFMEEDGTVYIRQFAEEFGEYQLLIISHYQLVDLVASIDAPEGAHLAKIGDSNDLPKD